MKNEKTRLLALSLLLAVACIWFVNGGKVRAQSGPSLVQQTATRLDASSQFCTTTAVVNSQVTCTMTPPAGQYVYITSIDLMVCQNGTSTANSNLTFTTTNISGAPIFQESLGAVANTCAPQHTIALPVPLKSAAPGTAVTIVSPAAQTNTAFTITVSWYPAF